MRIRCLTHVAVEEPYAIADWARARGHALALTALDAGEPLPRLDDLDMLVVMGGPMNAYEDVRHPWLTPEKRLIETAIAGGKRVLGVCLGAQLVAAALGAAVTRNPEREIGWWPVTLTDEARSSSLFPNLPRRFTCLHWHGDTFAIPDGAVRTASSEACPDQAFEYDGGRVAGLQFHLELTEPAVDALIDAFGHELAPGPFVSPAEDLRAGVREHGDACVALLGRFLDDMAAVAAAPPGDDTPSAAAPGGD